MKTHYRKAFSHADHGCGGAGGLSVVRTMRDQSAGQGHDIVMCFANSGERPVPFSYLPKRTVDGPITTVARKHPERGQGCAWVTRGTSAEPRRTPFASLSVLQYPLLHCAGTLFAMDIQGRYERMYNADVWTVDQLLSTPSTPASVSAKWVGRRVPSERQRRDNAAGSHMLPGTGDPHRRVPCGTLWRAATSSSWLLLE